jgi:hypothetical protein
MGFFSKKKDHQSYKDILNQAGNAYASAKKKAAAFVKLGKEGEDGKGTGGFNVSEEAVFYITVTAFALHANNFRSASLKISPTGYSKELHDALIMPLIEEYGYEGLDAYAEFFKYTEEYSGILRNGNEEERSFTLGNWVFLKSFPQSEIDADKSRTISLFIGFLLLE